MGYCKTAVYGGNTFGKLGHLSIFTSCIFFLQGIILTPYQIH